MLARAEAKVQAGLSYAAIAHPTGFTPLDDYLGGGLREGELALLGGAQGLGKTMMALQIARNAVAQGGRATYICYEHDVEQLLERLIAMEAGAVGGWDAPGLDEVHRALSTPGDERPLADRLGDCGDVALSAINSYGERLQLVRAAGSRTGPTELRELALAPAGQAPALLVVDYLQKVQASGLATTEDDRVTYIFEALKDLALDLGCPVLAIVASDKPGLAGRARLHHLRGSTALAYEADVALLLNDKFDIIARNHLMYGGTGTERYHDWVVCSIEKNRSGVAGVDLEFEKDFVHGRFVPRGRMVSEQLADERLGLE